MRFGNRFFSGSGQFVPAAKLESIFAEIYAFSPSFHQSFRFELREEWARINGLIEENAINDSVAFLISRDLYEKIRDALIDVCVSNVPDKSKEATAEALPALADVSKKMSPIKKGISHHGQPLEISGGEEEI